MRTWCNKICQWSEIDKLANEALDWLGLRRFINFNSLSLSLQGTQFLKKIVTYFIYQEDTSFLKLNLMSLNIMVATWLYYRMKEFLRWCSTYLDYIILLLLKKIKNQPNLLPLVNFILYYTDILFFYYLVNRQSHLVGFNTTLFQQIIKIYLSIIHIYTQLYIYILFLCSLSHIKVLFRSILKFYLLIKFKQSI